MEKHRTAGELLYCAFPLELEGIKMLAFYSDSFNWPDPWTTGLPVDYSNLLLKYNILVSVVNSQQITYFKNIVHLNDHLFCAFGHLSQSLFFFHIYLYSQVMVK